MEKQHHLDSFGLTSYLSCTKVNGLFPTLITRSKDAYRIAYWQILLFHYAIIQYFLRILLCTYPIMDHTTEVFFISRAVLSIEISVKGKMKKSRFGVSTKYFILSFAFVFETDLLGTTYLTNGWHTLRVISYKIKLQHIKK